MDVNVIDTVSGLGDLSIANLFMQANVVVKIVMALLCMSSLVSWTIILSKIIFVRGQVNKAKKFEHIFWSGQVLEKLYDNVKHQRDNAIVSVFITGIKEYKQGQHSSSIAASESIGNILRVECNRAIDKCENNIGMLATIGSVAPFVGLFGTVWGIMNSFQAIALTKNTTLAIVAPSIAEALLATACGLVVAVPAVVFYNHISAMINGFANRLDNFASELTVLLSKDIQ